MCLPSWETFAAAEAARFRAGGDLYVDETGRRFVDENRPWNAVAEAILALPGRRCWVITDAQSFKGRRSASSSSTGP